MAFLSTDQVRAVVIDSLRSIADLPGNVDEATFNQLTADHKRVFLTTLKNKLNALPYELGDGSTSDSAYYDVDLILEVFEEWPKVKDCIAWIAENQKVIFK